MKIILLSLFTIFLLAACSNSDSKFGKHKVYLYKHPSSDGIVCVFYGENEYAINQNANIFAEMHKEKYGIPLIVTAKPF